MKNLITPDIECLVSFSKASLYCFIVILFSSCIKSDKSSDFNYSDYEKFAKTPVAELAEYVDIGDTAKICEFLKVHPELIDYQEPYHKMTLLAMTVINQKRATFPYSLISSTSNGLSMNKGQVNSFHCLLNHGASVNTVDIDGNTPLMEACDCDIYSVDIVKDLIRHHATVNYTIPDKYADRLGNSTPLQNAIRNRRLDIVKVLVENGADINYKDKFNNTPLGLSPHDCNFDITLYLLEKGADYNIPYKIESITSEGNQIDTCITLAEDLKYYTFPLESEDYKNKMQVVRFLKSKGIDYYKVKVPDDVVSRIKQEYPGTWKEYLRKY